MKLEKEIIVLSLLVSFGFIAPLSFSLLPSSCVGRRDRKQERVAQQDTVVAHPKSPYHSPSIEPGDPSYSRETGNSIPSGIDTTTTVDVTATIDSLPNCGWRYSGSRNHRNTIAAADTVLVLPQTGTEDKIDIIVNPPKKTIALKTNLLFDALLAPNIEVEVPFGKHWSLMAESVFPWWVDKNNTWCYELLSGSVELRRWLGNKTSGRYRKPLTGHFIGLFAGGGKYDFERKGKGYQGEFFVAPGLSYGFAHSIGNRLNMEYSVGFGYMRTRYRHYHQSDIDNSVLLWQNNGRSTYIGPTKLKVSLVWLIGNYKGGRL